MNLSLRWVKVLGDSGIEAVHWSNVGALNAPDTEIMAYAKANDFVVLTHDLDFGAILAATHGDKPSVVQIRSDDVSAGAIANHLILALKQLATELELGALITIDPGRTRVSVLPLRSRD